MSISEIIKNPEKNPEGAILVLGLINAAKETPTGEHFNNLLDTFKERYHEKREKGFSKPHAIAKAIYSVLYHDSLITSLRQYGYMMRAKK